MDREKTVNERLSPLGPPPSSKGWPASLGRKEVGHSRDDHLEWTPPPAQQGHALPQHFGAERKTPTANEVRARSLGGPADQHYAELGAIQPLEVIEAWGLGYHLGNVIKYVARYRGKGGRVDLEKAKFYLDRFLQQESK